MLSSVLWGFLDNSNEITKFRVPLYPYDTLITLTIYKLTLYIMLKSLKVLTIILLAIQISAQDIVLSDYRLYQIQLNPALAGNGDGIRMSSFFQNTKFFNSTLSNAFGATVDAPVKLSKSISLGLAYQFFRDVAGESKFGARNHQLSTALTKKILKGNLTHALSVGMQYGINNQSVSNENLRWPSQIGPNGFDPTIPSGEPNLDLSFTYLALNIGANYSLKSDKNHQLDAGFAINNINRPIIAFLGNENKLFNRNIYYIRPTMMLTEKVGIVASIFFTEQGQHNSYNYSSGIVLTKNDKFINVNLGYQKNDMPFVSIFLGNKNIKFGSNYIFVAKDIGASKLEAFMSYTFTKKEKA